MLKKKTTTTTTKIKWNELWEKTVQKNVFFFIECVLIFLALIFFGPAKQFRKRSRTNEEAKKKVNFIILWWFGSLAIFTVSNYIETKLQKGSIQSMKKIPIVMIVRALHSDSFHSNHFSSLVSASIEISVCVVISWNLRPGRRLNWFNYKWYRQPEPKSTFANWSLFDSINGWQLTSTYVLYVSIDQTTLNRNGLANSCSGIHISRWH